MLFVKTPSNVLADDQKLFNSVSRLAEESGVEFIDYNKQYERIGLVMNEDFYDKSHLNYKGAEKFTQTFSKDIAYFFPELVSKKFKDVAWDSDLDEYYRTVTELNYAK